MDCSTSETTAILQAIGLSPGAAECYVFLLQKLPLAFRASRIERELHISRSKLYRSLDELEAKGFITADRLIAATNFRALPIGQAMDAYMQYQWQQVAPLTQGLHKSPLSGTISPR